jgi:PPK2 family polyphosphate:nucleotide phosphotransferase
MPALLPGSVPMDFARYRVKPGSKVDLKRWDPDDRSASPGTKEERERHLAELAAELDKLQDVLYAEHERCVLVVLQGMDTSGKDGTIRHVFGEVDPLGVRVAGFKRPTEEEASHDFLWRVHQKVPGKGEMVIFNRSHYEDVLVVRVHKWITDAECKRRYEQIREFEQLLIANSTVVIKFFLHISKDEQKRRLQERLNDPKKQWKFNLGDLAERKLWRDYTKAYADALGATSTAAAPWYVVPSNSKTNRNMIVSSVLRDTLKALKPRYPRPTEKLEGVVID